MASFKVTGRLNLDGSNFQAGMSRAESSIKRLGSSVAGSLKGQLAAAFSVGAVAMLTRRTMEYADSIDETASRIGVGAEKLQEWAYAAKQAGSNTEQLAAFVERLTMAALDPSKQALFGKMGIKPEGMTSGGLFESVSSWARGKQASEVTPILRELTGFKGVGTLLNTLQTDLAAAGEEARRMGAVMDDVTREKLAKLNDQFSILSQILFSTFGPVLVKVGQAFLELVGIVSGLVEALKNFKWRNGDEMAGAFFAEVWKFSKMAQALDQPSGGKLPESTIGPPAAAAARSASAGRSQLPDGNAAMRVGNFLGAGGMQSLSNLAQQQLRVQQQQLWILTQHYREIQRMSNGFAELMGV